MITNQFQNKIIRFFEYSLCDNAFLLTNLLNSPINSDLLNKPVYLSQHYF